MNTIRRYLQGEGRSSWMPGRARRECGAWHSLTLSNETLGCWLDLSQHHRHFLKENVLQINRDGGVHLIKVWPIKQFPGSKISQESIHSLILTIPLIIHMMDLFSMIVVHYKDIDIDRVSYSSHLTTRDYLGRTNFEVSWRNFNEARHLWDKNQS